MTKLTKEIIQELRELEMEWLKYCVAQDRLRDGGDKLSFVYWLEHQEQEQEDSRGELTYTEKALTKAAEEHQEIPQKKCTCLIANDGTRSPSLQHPCPVHQEQEQECTDDNCAIRQHDITSKHYHTGKPPTQELEELPDRFHIPMSDTEATIYDKVNEVIKYLKENQCSQP